MPQNASGIHWHGIRQLNTNPMDGVGGITECMVLKDEFSTTSANFQTGPLAPGQTTTYTFHATQFGTTWYHSHFSAQYGDGIVGALIIRGQMLDEHTFLLYADRGRSGLDEL